MECKICEKPISARWTEHYCVQVEIANVVNGASDLFVEKDRERVVFHLTGMQVFPTCRECADKLDKAFGDEVRKLMDEAKAGNHDDDEIVSINIRKMEE